MGEASDSIELAVMNLPGGRRLRFALSTWRGRKGLDIRIHFFDPDASEWRPSKQGIRIPLEQAEEFKRVVLAVCERILQGNTPRQGEPVEPIIPPRTPGGGAPGTVEEEGMEHDPEERMEEYLGLLDNP